MRNALQRILPMLFCACFVTWAHNAPAKEAQTIDELVAMFDDSTCAQCHEEIYDQWQSSWHAQAVVSSLKGMRNFIVIGLAKEWKTKPSKAQLLKCLDCHAPAVNYASEKLALEIGQLIVTAFDKKDSPAGKKARTELAKLKVGCLSCHNIKATAVTRGLHGPPIKGAIYGPEGIMAEDDDGHDSIETVDMTRSAFCMQCHGRYKAPDGETIQCNTLSGSYQNAYISQGGSRSCQDCHMKNGHTFPGGHDLDTVKEGLSFDVEVTPYRHLPGKIKGVKDNKAWVPSVVVTAKITNNTGHRVPDG